MTGNLPVLGIFINLSKSFDTMSHAEILENLSLTGVKGVEYELSHNCLFNQKQTVIYDRVASDLQYVLSSVPLELILGPLLFLIAYGGLNEVLIHCKIILTVLKIKILLGLVNWFLRCLYCLSSYLLWKSQDYRFDLACLLKERSIYTKDSKSH